MGLKQKQISEVEKRTDMHISTLRRTVQAMGGNLSLVVQFPGPPARHSGRDYRDRLILGKAAP
jgi:hypothetical protein